MKLIGSYASPYVRRISLLLGSKSYEFETVNVFSKDGQQVISQFSPTLRIPILVDGEAIIWDSLLITEYLLNEPIKLEVKKELIMINEMTDAGIQLFQLRKFEVDKNDESAFSLNNLKRIKQVLDYFEIRNMDDWNLTSQWLFCTLDWFEFREIFNWRKDHPKLKHFFETNTFREDIKKTNPRIRQ